jgi:solute carrier family 25 (adenine nucleotide translocator) protein 4/5/6/31
LIELGRLDRRYTGTFDCIGRIVREEGVWGLFRGNMVAVVRFFPTQMLNPLIRYTLRNLAVYDRQRSYTKWFLSNLASGTLAGAISLLFVYPIDYITTRLVCDVPDASTSKYQFSSPLDVALQTVETEGFFGLYRGFLASVVGIAVYRGLYFGFYDALRPFIPRDNFLATFLVGWGVTIGAGLLSYPIDTIRRKMMLHSASEPGYRNTLGTTITIYKKEGIIGFFNGAGTNICRAVVGAAVLAGYDQFQLAFFKRRQ